MTPRVNVGVNEIEICQGETLTVWFNPNVDRKCENRQQVELRVQEDGTFEIFRHNDGNILVDDFEQWRPMKERT